MVLTHLILNGMIKVKGQLGEMAKCLEDPDPRISDLAKLFFKELSTKDNALYNNLQDVISHLSVGKFKVDEESFEKTMRFIFTFIEKVCPSHFTSLFRDDIGKTADQVGQAGRVDRREVVPEV
jgi:condensin complex subunit 1